MEKATFAGGCFWCFEAIFKRVKGVTHVESGYAGGDRDKPSYDQVTTGTTGHAEAVQITFDQGIISYEKLLEIFWHLHDPTTLNRQGADVGTQYRSVIFYHDDKQKELATASKTKMEKSGELHNDVVTEILPLEKFYKAEDYHQDFYEKNQNYPYCSIVIDPKIEKLLKDFNDSVKDEYKSV